jgi:hypothetical protein
MTTRSSASTAAICFRVPNGHWVEPVQTEGHFLAGHWYLKVNSWVYRGADTSLGNAIPSSLMVHDHGPVLLRREGWWKRVRTAPRRALLTLLAAYHQYHELGTYTEDFLREAADESWYGPFSRRRFDAALRQLVREKLVYENQDDTYIITSRGLITAVQYGLRTF